MKKLKIGLIGTGYTIGIANEHVKGYQKNENAEIVALYDIVPDRAEKWALEKELKKVEIANSLEDLFEKVDAVSICVPNASHIDLGIKAIDAKKHFICEKPLSVDYNEGKRLVDYAKLHKDVISVICFNYRNIPAIKYAKKLIDDGKIGKVYSCSQQLGGGRIANPKDVLLEWRMDRELSGHGALSDFGCHMLDLADFLLSENNGKIKEVQGFKNTFIENRTKMDGSGLGNVTNDDVAVFNAMTEGGTLLSFTASRIGIPYQTLQIIAEGGIIVFNGNHGDELGIQLKDKNGGYSEPLKIEKVPEEFLGEEGHAGLINEFVNGILFDKKVARNLERGLYIQDIIEKIAESTKTQKTFQI